MTTKDRRLELHEKLCSILGSRNVYFQPPEKFKLKYPCIVYHRGSGKDFLANNELYLFKDSYDVVVIFTDPDDDLPNRVHKSFQYIRKETPYTADNLNHVPFYLYY